MNPYRNRHNRHARNSSDDLIHTISRLVNMFDMDKHRIQLTPDLYNDVKMDRHGKLFFMLGGNEKNDGMNPLFLRLLCRIHALCMLFRTQYIYRVPENTLINVPDRSFDVDPYEVSHAIQLYLFIKFKEGSSFVELGKNNIPFINKFTLIRMVRDSLSITKLEKENARWVLYAVAINIANDVSI